MNPAQLQSCINVSRGLQWSPTCDNMWIRCCCCCTQDQMHFFMPKQNSYSYRNLLSVQSVCCHVDNQMQNKGTTFFSQRETGSREQRTVLLPLLDQLLNLSYKVSFLHNDFSEVTQVTLTSWRRSYSLHWMWTASRCKETQEQIHVSKAA